MKGDLFRFAQGQGIYQTMYLWAKLSPNLASPEVVEPPGPDVEGESTDKAPSGQSG